MSCDVALSAFLFLASTGSGGPHPMLIPAVATSAPPSVAKEPLFADIVSRAGKLKAEIEAYRGPKLAGSATAVTLPRWDAITKQVTDLAALDMQGHVELAKRGTTDDLKCILKGISQDLPVKLKGVEDAKTGKDQDLALREMSYLLRDNVEVITSPPKPAA
jgi:hypothetical protein